MKKILTVFVAVAVSLAISLSAQDAHRPKKPLVVYFSLYGNDRSAVNVDATTSASIVADRSGRRGATEYIARLIADETGADIIAIKAQKKYSADFQTVVKENDREAKSAAYPAIADGRADLSAYDTIYLGYPIWNLDAPRPVYTFLKANDLAGKKVVLFCTHAGYNFGHSDTSIAREIPAATVVKGLAVRDTEVPAAKETVAEWIRTGETR